MKPTLRTLFEESPSRTALHREISRYESAHVPAGALVLDLGGGGAFRYADVFPRYATLNADLAARPDVAADLVALPVRDRSVRACISIAVLEHLPDPARALAEIARILAPGGTAFLWVPFLHEVHLYPSDYWRFTVEGIRSLVTRAGLEPVEASSAGFQGSFWTLAHLYRFFFQPTRPRFVAKLAGFSVLQTLARLGRAHPGSPGSSRFYTGSVCIARAPRS